MKHKPLKVKEVPKKVYAKARQEDRFIRDIENERHYFIRSK